MIDLRETICALSSAPGRAGIAVVRLSGPDSLAVVAGMFRPRRRQLPLPARAAVLGDILDIDGGAVVDEVLVTHFPGPESYTGEDMVEVALHGSPVLTARLLDNLCRRGARLAKPGEFTMRAFLRGKMDLAQAEAVRDVIEAQTVFQAQVASRQRAGEMAAWLAPVKDLLVEIVVQLESAVEFVEEDLELESRAQLRAKLQGVVGELRKWVDSYGRGRLVHDGFNLAVVGLPNVGKSSLFNALLVQDRSIVAETPGTTRDTVAEHMNLSGIPVRLVDTAGVREAEDRIERIGVERSYRALADADGVIVVLDAGRPPTEQDRGLLERTAAISGVIAINKSDLADSWGAERVAELAGDRACVRVSARTGEGLEELRKRLLEAVAGRRDLEGGGMLVTSLRHCQCLCSAADHVEEAQKNLGEGMSEEFVLADLHRGLNRLGEITGETGVEDILDAIFAKFCVGK